MTDAESECLDVLIVDDNEDFARNLGELLSTSAVSLTTVGTVGAATEAVNLHAFDVVFLDERLPDGSGLEVLRRLRERGAMSVVVVITAYASTARTADALNDGASGFVSKDSAPEVLVEALMRALERARFLGRIRRLRADQEAILATLPDLLVLFDDRLNVASINRDEPRLSTGASDHLGVSLESALHPDVFAQLNLTEWMEQARRGDRAGGRVIGTEAEGEFEVQLFAVAGEARSTYLLRFADVTIRTQLEHRLHEAERLAALGRLSSSVAHQIRNPVAGVRVLAQLLERTVDEASPSAEHIAEILRLTDRMSAIVSDLLQFARPESRSLRPVDAWELLMEVARDAVRWPQCREHVIDSDVPADVSGLVVGDPARLTAALAALVENALDAAPAAGCVRLAGRRAGDHVEWTVEDDGPGFEDDDPALALKPFYSRKSTGTGLGLAIAERIVRDHGGGIRMGRSPDLGGASVTLRLPVAAGVAVGEA